MMISGPIAAVAINTGVNFRDCARTLSFCSSVICWARPDRSNWRSASSPASIFVNVTMDTARDAAVNTIKGASTLGFLDMRSMASPGVQRTLKRRPKLFIGDIGDPPVAFLHAFDLAFQVQWVCLS